MEKCRQCGELFAPLAVNQVYCSKRCSALFKRSAKGCDKFFPSITFDCAHCGRKVVTEPGVGDKRTRFCSHECEKKYWRHPRQKKPKLPRVYTGGNSHIASVSFGRDSLCMLLMLIEKGWQLDKVVFFDTGMMFESIYRMRDNVKPFLESRGIELVELHPSKSFEYLMFEKPMRNAAGKVDRNGYSWCGYPMLWGHGERVSAIERYKRELRKEFDVNVCEYFGLAADEVDRVGKWENHGNKRFPLVEWGITKADCMAYCRQRGYEWIENGVKGPINLYDMRDWGGCWCCANRTIDELREMYRYLPQYWEGLKRLQARTERPIKGYCKNGTPYRSVFDLEKLFKEEGRAATLKT